MRAGNIYCTVHSVLLYEYIIVHSNERYACVQILYTSVGTVQKTIRVRVCEGAACFFGAKVII